MTNTIHQNSLLKALLQRLLFVMSVLSMLVAVANPVLVKADTAQNDLPQDKEESHVIISAFQLMEEQDEVVSSLVYQHTPQQKDQLADSFIKKEVKEASNKKNFDFVTSSNDEQKNRFFLRQACLLASSSRLEPQVDQKYLEDQISPNAP